MEAHITSGDTSLFFESDIRGGSAMLQILGLVLIAAMPSSGLREAVESLHEVYEFHAENLRLPPSNRRVAEGGLATLVEPSKRAGLVLEE
ncbi:MAG: hypothetical protein OXE73_05515 [Gammaproteobacteria bacterium]|nr:hypothetical protein [Gammaproteobacteria bacterium]